MTPTHIYIGANWRMLVGLAVMCTLSACSDWMQTFDPKGENAYDLAFLPQVLAKAYPEARVKRITSTSLMNGELVAERSAYLAVGQALSYNEEEAIEMHTYLASGGYALLAGEAVSNTLLSFFLSEECLVDNEYKSFHSYDSIVPLLAREDRIVELPVLGPFIPSRISGRVMDYGKQCLSEAAAEVILAPRERYSHALNSQNFAGKSAPVVMLRLPVGEGTLDLLSYPLALTNIYATDSLGQVLFSEIIGQLPNDVNLIQYDYSRRSNLAEVLQENRSDEEEDELPNTANNILKHVLNEPAFASAWYLMLLGGLLFVLFGAKRKQRVIPLLQPKRNKSHEHLANISRLYLNRPNNRLMAEKQLSLFEHYVYKRFGLSPLSSTVDFEQLCEMDGVNRQIMESLTRYKRTINRKQPITNNALVKLVNLLHQFYKDVGRQHVTV